MPVIEEITDERYPADVEATAYFAVAEALADVAKAQAQEARVKIETRDGRLCVEVSTTASAGRYRRFRPARARGPARRGGRDAADESPPGAGTTLTISLPAG